MSDKNPEYIRIAGSLYRRAPEGEVHTAQNAQQHIQQFQNTAEALSGALTKLEKAAPLVAQKVAAIRGPLENANKAMMGKKFPQAMQILGQLKPQVAEFKTGVVDVILPLIQGITEKMTPEAVDGLVQDVNTISALVSAEGGGLGVSGAQPTTPTAPVPSGVATPPLAPAQAPAPAA